ncbi:hypothetical protein C482_09912 [Natrialba chahannaoensis JCM 10990]|uniref:DUF4013 domain-containing protein n=1 Tax=Natrialba chahannaoensis JCM 10990 TaxID=1227492 RepID=M0APB6_9EURY|nr:DUF4013 domain-containing protein [Natrialba chahannaoensis]ELY99792.1 hypothetical protein C482_09912 [Natrialba chahannaoensis JCM 10990]
MASRLHDGLTFPFRGDHTLDLFAVGGLFGLLTAIAVQLAVALGASNPLLALPFVAVATTTMIALLGYLGRVFATTVAADDTPPSFRPLRPLFDTGCRLLVITLGYLTLVAALVGTTITLLTRLPITPDSIDFGGLLLFFGLSTVALVAVLLVGYTVPIVIGRLATDASAHSSLPLDDGETHSYRTILAHGGYWVSWLFAALVVVPGWAFLIIALSSATALGVVAVFVAFYAHVVATRLAADGYRRALE